MSIRATGISAAKPGTLHVSYSDGNTVDVDISPRLRVGIFVELTDFELFSRVEIDEVGGAEWPNGASLSPEFLLGQKPQAVSSPAHMKN
ncbi:MAG: DUF2442 domain-containing protein [Tepidiformaceae bacterium]